MDFRYTFGSRLYDLASRTHVMGILNVTPDSFSDGGKFLAPEKAVEQALRMIEEGADFIDIGGESTRPQSQAYGTGAEPVALAEELERVIPVIESLARQTDVPLSIDTYKAEVARRALEAGACIVNDISAFALDPEMPRVAANGGAAVILMHMKGTPRTMQTDPVYGDLFGEISLVLKTALAAGSEAGIRQMIVDPGIGFGKTAEDNMRLIGGLEYFLRLGYPLLVGASRKSFIGKELGLPVEDRLEGSIAAAVAAVLHGAHIVRAHDVRATVRAVRMTDGIARVPRSLPPKMP